MCFNPAISLTTAIIEFILGTIILLKFRKSTISKFIVILIYFLGLYQLTEFMLCVTNKYALWGSLGYIVYTFLPAIALHFSLRFTHSKNSLWFLYIPAIFFASIPLISGKFIIDGVCHTVFITVTNRLFQWDNLAFYIYIFYYFGYIALTHIVILAKYRIVKNKIRKRLYLIILSALFIATFPAVLLVVIAPSLTIILPSFYCEFSLVFAIMAYICAHLNDKYKAVT